MKKREMRRLLDEMQREIDTLRAPYVDLGMAVSQSLAGDLQSGGDSTRTTLTSVIEGMIKARAPDPELKPGDVPNETCDNCTKPSTWICRSDAGQGPVIGAHCESDYCREVAGHEAGRDDDDEKQWMKVEAKL